MTPHFQSDAHIVFVDEIEEKEVDPDPNNPPTERPGVCRDNDWRQILIDWDAEHLDKMATVLAHEMGHGTGSGEGNSHPEDFIMRQGAPFSKNKLSYAEAEGLSTERAN